MQPRGRRVCASWRSPPGVRDAHVTQQQARMVMAGDRGVQLAAQRNGVPELRTQRGVALVVELQLHELHIRLRAVADVSALARAKRPQWTQVVARLRLVALGDAL